MSGHRKYKITDYRLGLLLVALREKSGLTQKEIGDAVQVSRRTIQHWEAGTAFPDTNHVKSLVKCFLSKNVFHPGKEKDEIKTLWEQADESAVRRRTPFDELWVDDLISQVTGPQSQNLTSQAPIRSLLSNIDWSDAPDVREIYGRSNELAELSRWVLEQNARFVVMLGMGGIGKTTLSIRFVQSVASQFEFVIWRSLQNAPRLDELLVDCLQVLSPVNTSRPTMSYLLELMQKHRCLIVLDNMETLHKTGDLLGEYRAGYEDYQLFFRRLAQTHHKSCVILTSRELPVELEPMAGERDAVKVMRVSGLTPEACQVLLNDKELFGPVESWAGFVRYYGGNPLALKIAANMVRELFGGDLAAFLNETPITLHTLNQLLNHQFENLAPLEREVMYWFAIEREAISLDKMRENIPAAASQNALLAALMSLRQRSLLERGDVGTAFNLQPVLLEYVTNRIVAQLSEEISKQDFTAIAKYPLLKSKAREYVRESQIRMILLPILERLRMLLGSTNHISEHLRKMVANLRGLPLAEHGFSGGNLINLLGFLNGHIQGEDFSNLSVRQVYLQGMEAQDANFSGTELIDPLLTEPIETIGAMALSPKGKYLAASCYNGQIHTWRAEDGKPLWTVSGVQREWTLAFSPDETILASGGYTGEICLWDTSNGRLLNKVAGHRVWVYALAFQADGSRLASGGYYGSVRIWNTLDMSLEFVLEGHTGSIISIGFTPDGSMLVTSSRDGSIRVWDLNSKICIHVLRHGEQNSELKTAIHPGGRWLASCCENDSFVKLWDIKTGECLGMIETRSRGLGSIAFDPDGEILACGNREGGVGFWKVDSDLSPQFFRMLNSHQHHVEFISFAQQGLFATLSYGESIKLWDARNGRLLKRIDGYSRLIGATAFSVDGKLLVQGDANGRLRVWDVEHKCYRSTFQGHAGPIWMIVMSPDGKKFASCADDRLIKLWDLNEQKCLNTFVGHTGRLFELAFNPDGTLLASGGTDRGIKIWSTVNDESANLLQSIEKPFDQVWSLAFDPSGKLLASGHANGEINLWQVETGEHVTAMHHATALWGDLIGALRFSSDGKFLFSSSSNELLRRWDISSGDCVVTPARVSGNRNKAIEIEQDGKFVVTGCAEPQACLWILDEMGGDSQPIRLSGHTSRVWTVALSPNGRLLASSDEEGHTILSDLQSKTILYQLSLDRPYERMNIKDAKGLNLAERAALVGLGASNME